MILYSKFFEGAWIALILVPGFWFLFMGIKRHYIEVYRASASRHPIDVTKVGPLKVVVPVQRWSSISERGITFAMNLSPDVTAIHIETGTDAKGLEILKRDWNLFVEEPLRAAERAVPELKVIHSPYRRVITPILEYVRELRSEHPNQQIVVVIPELSKPVGTNISSTTSALSPSKPHSSSRAKRHRRHERAVVSPSTPHQTHPIRNWKGLGISPK